MVLCAVLGHAVTSLLLFVEAMHEPCERSDGPHKEICMNNLNAAHNFMGAITSVPLAVLIYQSTSAVPVMKRIIRAIFDTQTSIDIANEGIDGARADVENANAGIAAANEGISGVMKEVVELKSAVKDSKSGHWFGY